MLHRVSLLHAVRLQSKAFNMGQIVITDTHYYG